MAAETVVNSGSSNELLPVQHQAITWTNDNIVNCTFRNNHDNHIFFQKYVLQNGACKIAAILFWPQSVKVRIQWPQS